MRRIYLDRATTTPARPELVQAMLPYFTEIFGNTSSMYSGRQEAKRAVEGARVKMTESIGARCDEFVSTGGGTEADNCALKGLIYDRKDNRNTGSAFSLPASFPGY